MHSARALCCLAVLLLAPGAAALELRTAAQQSTNPKFIEQNGQFVKNLDV